MINKETKVVCPHCGQEILIPNHEYVTMGTVIGKDSNLGVVTLTPADGHEVVNPLDKSRSRIDALRKAGVKGNFFAMDDGRVSSFDVEKGCISILDDDDPIFNAIINGGTIPNKNLFRRWVLAQMLRALDSKGGYTQYIHNLGYRYSWNMVIEEARVQARLANTDKEYYEERRKMFDVIKSVIDMASSYIAALREYVATAKIRHCKRVPYKRIGTRDVFVSEIDSKIFKPLESVYSKIQTAQDEEEMYSAAKEFMKHIIYFKELRQDRTWIDFYKLSGSYYSLKNLFLFHGAFIRDDNNRKLYKETAVEYLDKKVYSCNSEGWRMLGVLKKVINDNGIDIHEMRGSWRKD